MACLERGTSPPRKRRPRLSLETWRSRNCSTGGEHSDDTAESDLAQRFGEALWAARNAWSIERHRNGLAVLDRRLSRTEADRQLRRSLAALAEGGA